MRSGGAPAFSGLSEGIGVQEYEGTPLPLVVSGTREYRKTVGPGDVI